VIVQAAIATPVLVAILLAATGRWIPRRLVDVTAVVTILAMMAMLGAVVGWEPLFGLLVLASVAGAIVGGFVAWRSGAGMQAALPFGVFLGLAALAIVFFGPTLWECYLAVLPR